MELYGDTSTQYGKSEKGLTLFSSKSEGKTHQYLGNKLCTQWEQPVTWWDQHWYAVNWIPSGDKIGSECFRGYILFVTIVETVQENWCISDLPIVC
jgi:hypothetical protein